MTIIKTIPYRSTFLAKEAEDAWKYFQESGYPDSKNENWRFSNPKPWLNLSGDRILSNNNIEGDLSDYIIPSSIPLIIVNEKLASFLICKNRAVNFYKKNNWRKIDKKKVRIMDHKFNTNGMFYNFDILNKKKFLFNKSLIKIYMNK